MRANCLRNLPGNPPLTELGFGEIQGKRVDRLAGSLLREIGDRRRIDAA